MDPQANATSGLGIDWARLPSSVYNVVIEASDIESAVVPTRVPGLAYALESLTTRYDFIVLDCPPSLGLLTINALVAAEWMIIPLQCEYYALEGLGQLAHTHQLVRQELNPRLKLGGIVLTLFDPRTALAWQVADEVRRKYPEQTFQTVIPRNVRLSEAPSHGLPINLYDPTSRGAMAYHALAKELIGE